MSYLDGLWKAQEIARSYAGPLMSGETNAAIKAIDADIDFEIVRFHREQAGLREVDSRGTNSANKRENL